MNSLKSLSPRHSGKPRGEPPLFNRNSLWLCVTLALAVGCDALPESGNQLLPTPDSNVVCDDAGRGSYDWTLEGNKFHVTQTFNSNLFQAVDVAQVQARVAQALTEPATPIYEAPTWLDEELRLTIEACLHSSDTTPVRKVTLAQEPLTATAAQKARLALNEDGSRVLVVTDKLSLWDTRTGRLLKEVASPTNDPRFVYLSPTCDRAFVFDTQAGYRIALDGATGEGSLLRSPASITQPLGEIAATKKRDRFFVQSGSQVVCFDVDLQLIEDPQITMSKHGSMAYCEFDNRLAIVDGGQFTITNLSENYSSQYGRVRSELKPRAILAGPATHVFATNVFGVFEHEIVTLFSPETANPRQGGSIAPVTKPICQTRLNIDRAFFISGQDADNLWITVCAEFPTTGNDSPLYQMFDVNLPAGTNAFPTVVGMHPDQIEMSGNGHVAAVARANEPVQLLFRGPRLMKYAEMATVVSGIADLFRKDRSAQAEELIESLERYAAAAPYSFKTRSLLDLKSAVAKELARPTNLQPAGQQAMRFQPAGFPRVPQDVELPSELDAWLEKKSTLALLVRAANLATRVHGRTKPEFENWEKNIAEVKTLVDEIMARDQPPCMAFEILANLTAIRKLDPESLNKPFAYQFQRDPLNPELHMCMASFFTPERAGDNGQPEAYLSKLTQLLPANERDQFYALYVLKIARALAPEERLWPTNSMPQPYDLIGGPYRLNQSSYAGPLPEQRPWPAIINQLG